MALKSTIFKIDLEIADMDRGYYESHPLTVARHPSESDDRMMMRILAFALNAHESLEFGAGISTEDEPDLWRRSLSGEIEQWIDLGLPDERRVRRACGRADEVMVYCYGGGKVDAWWAANEKSLTRSRNLTVFEMPWSDTIGLGELASRGASFQCNIQDGVVSLFNGDQSAEVTPRRLHPPT
ncbi:MAG: hypothetical protein ACI8TX_001714 [Hyphomicrobiaceae bacterium]|jgi:uncharacterized protein YaeQ